MLLSWKDKPATKGRHSKVSESKIAIDCGLKNCLINGKPAKELSVSELMNKDFIPSVDGRSTKQEPSDFDKKVDAMWKRLEED